ncbi:MAG: sulfatase, partial [Opitutae bacterium]|nr:sulfatase [Opitutae bacterium]
LDTWLKQTKAQFPQLDPRFDSAKRKARWENIKSQGKQKLEKQHASFLEPTYKPNKDWWGSMLD